VLLVQTNAQCSHQRHIDARRHSHCVLLLVELDAEGGYSTVYVCDDQI
jgi:hypothetical protein